MVHYQELIWVLLSWGKRPGWPWYWNLGVKQVQLNYRRTLQCPCKWEAIASDTWSLYWLSGTDEMYSQEETDNAVFRGMLSSRGILQVEPNCWITQWSWSLGKLHYLELIWITLRRKPTRLTLSLKIWGSSRYKRALLLQLGQSCPDNETLQKNNRVCHMCIKCMSQLTKVGNLSTRKALDSCSWKEWASRYAFLKVQSLYELIGWVRLLCSGGHYGRLATTL